MKTLGEKTWLELFKEKILETQRILRQTKETGQILFVDFKTKTLLDKPKMEIKKDVKTEP